jgi:hypothetical protein
MGGQRSIRKAQRSALLMTFCESNAMRRSTFIPYGLGGGNDLSSCPPSMFQTNSTLSWPPATPI